MDAATLYMIVTLAEGTGTEAFPQESVDYCLQAQENPPAFRLSDVDPRHRRHLTITTADERWRQGANCTLGFQGFGSKTKMP